MPTRKCKKEMRYKCIVCDFYTNRKFDMRRHIELPKHKRKIKNASKKVPLMGLFEGPNGSWLGIMDKKVNNSTNTFTKKVSCEHCGKTICRKKNLKRHYKTCGGIKKSQELSTVKYLLQEMEKKNEKENKQNILIIDLVQQVMKDSNQKGEMCEKMIETMNDMKEHFKTGKTIGFRGSTDACKPVTTKYAKENFFPPYSYDQLISKPLTEEEKEYMRTFGPKKACISLITNRCVKDVDPDKRSFHCTDGSRTKFLLYKNGEWTIDNDGKDILTPVFEKIKPEYEKINREHYEKMKKLQRLKAARRNGEYVSEEEFKSVENIQADSIIYANMMNELSKIGKSQDRNNILKEIINKTLLTNIGVKDGKCIVYGQDTKQLEE